jgi:uncharacterized protein YndB with AHSA1/START domain
VLKKKKSEMRDKDYSPEKVILEYVPNVKISFTWEHKDIPAFPWKILMKLRLG